MEENNFNSIGTTSGRFSSTKENKAGTPKSVDEDASDGWKKQEPYWREVSFSTAISIWSGRRVTIKCEVEADNGYGEKEMVELVYPGNLPLNGLSHTEANQGKWYALETEGK